MTSELQNEFSGILDFCTGSSSAGGPDDTILTSYRNLAGNDQSTRFFVVGMSIILRSLIALLFNIPLICCCFVVIEAYYTQRCLANYYPYDFLGKYFDKLGMAQTSIDALIKTLSRNLSVIQNQCGTDDGELFLSLAQSMKSNLNLLKDVSIFSRMLFCSLLSVSLMSDNTISIPFVRLLLMHSTWSTVKISMISM